MRVIAVAKYPLLSFSSAPRVTNAPTIGGNHDILGASNERHCTNLRMIYFITKYFFLYQLQCRLRLPADEIVADTNPGTPSQIIHKAERSQGAHVTTAHHKAGIISVFELPTMIH